MAQAARAYGYGEERAYRAPRRTRPDIRVVPGGRQREQQTSQATMLITLARVFAVVLVLIAVLGIASISLNSATLRATVVSSNYSEQITKARAQGNVLDSLKGTLDNSVRIKQMASELGMAAPVYSDLISLEPDVIATDEAGNLSFARSVERAYQTAS
ncbi:MAG: cell division protein FtsL [Eggerthellaceae bacterium]|nr:cell division protein FtsL [Eggerthellaceae bacterium]